MAEITMVFHDEIVNHPRISVYITNPEVAEAASKYPDMVINYYIERINGVNNYVTELALCRTYLLGQAYNVIPLGISAPNMNINDIHIDALYDDDNIWLPKASVRVVNNELYMGLPVEFITQDYDGVELPSFHKIELSSLLGFIYISVTQ